MNAGVVPSGQCVMPSPDEIPKWETVGDDLIPTNAAAYRIQRALLKMEGQ